MANDTIRAIAPLLFGIYFRQEEFDHLIECMKVIIKRKHLVSKQTNKK